MNTRLLIGVILLCLSGTAVPAAAPAGIAGTWLFRNETMEIQFVAQANGRFARTQRLGQETDKSAGTYTFANGILELHPDGGGEVIRLHARLVSATVLEITDDAGNGVQLIRQAPPAAAPTSATRPKTLRLTRFTEPKEKAFTILVPAGWKTVGGLAQLDPRIVGVKNVIEPKGDLTLRNDDAGTVEMHWMPDLYFAEVRDPTLQSMFPPWKEYNGVISMPKLPPEQFLVQIVLPLTRKNIQQLKVVESHPVPKLAERYVAYMRMMPPFLQQAVTYRSASVKITYQENGVAYTERLVTVVEDYGELGAGLWRNRETFAFRAPSAVFADWLPVLDAIQRSIKFDAKWLIAAMRASAERANKVAELERYITKIDREIVDHRRATNAEINNDMFLTLTGQEEYVNPHTKEVEIGSNQWKYRWESGNGDVIYTDDPNYDPTRDRALHRSDYKRSAVRPRKP